jgi:hypothetical protein
MALAGTLMCTGCSELTALHSFVPENEAVLDARLPGVWMDGDEMYIVRPDGNGYAISRSQKESAAVYKLKATLLKVGDATILDLMPAEEDLFQIAAHTPLRVWVDDTKLRIAFLDSQWLRAQASGQLAVQALDGRLLITSPADQVTRFLLTYGADDRAYGKPVVLTKHP